MTNEDVADLLKSGFAAESVIAQINVSACDFNTSIPALQEVKGNRVPDTVILAVVQAPKGTLRSTSLQPSGPSVPRKTHLEQQDQQVTSGCMAVRPTGSHDCRNVMLFGAAGAIISHQRYLVVEFIDYPSHVGKYHGNDLQTVQSRTRVALLPKHYTAEDLHKACH